MTVLIVGPYPVLVRNRNQALLSGPVILPDLPHHMAIPVRNLAVNLERVTRIELAKLSVAHSVPHQRHPQFWGALGEGYPHFS